jgi:hypothetical protein
MLQKYSIVTWTYNFSKFGEHFIKSIIKSSQRVCILIARILIVLITILELMTHNPFIKNDAGDAADDDPMVIVEVKQVEVVKGMLPDGTPPCGQDLGLRTLLHWEEVGDVAKDAVGVVADTVDDFFLSFARFPWQILGMEIVPSVSG